MPLIAGMALAIAEPRVNRPRSTALIEFKNLRFLVAEQPSERNMDRFIKELKTNHVSVLVQAGGGDYSVKQLMEAGIEVVDLQFKDGMAPADDIINAWFQIVRDHKLDSSENCIAVHCKAGLGRAPVLVAVALIELGMKYEDAVFLIRQRRPGAINAKQLDYLSNFRRRSRLSSRNKCLSCLPFL